MAYDVAILDSNGTLLAQVSLAYDDHEHLVAAAREYDLPVLQRMADYYEDVEISSEEISSLLHELEMLRHRAESQSHANATVVQRLIELAQAAKARQVGLTCIAD